MDMDMEHYHCGWCGKYVAPDDGYYGDAEEQPQQIYCDAKCCLSDKAN